MAAYTYLGVDTNMLDALYAPHLRVGFHSFAWSTKTFLYNIMEQRYEQNNMGYQISRILDNDPSNIFESDTAAIYA